jgi:lipid A 3-O-deacylase
MLKSFALALLVFCLIPQVFAGPLAVVPVPDSPTADFDPTEHWQVGLETSSFWKFGGNATDLNYQFLAQIVTFKSPAVLDWKLGSGILVVRNRLSFLGEAIIEGPESYFFGVTGGASMEWWNAQRNFSIFLSSGGGVGVMDSKGYEVVGGQGQDFNFTWYVHAGAVYRFADRWSATLGIYYQHISNRGQDPVNPGVDALGPTLGISRHF